MLSCWYMTLAEQIREDLKAAMKAKDQTRVQTLRGVLTGLTNEAVAKGQQPDAQLADEDVIAVIKRAVKQRDDSIQQYRDASREELAEQEQQEREILAAYLPETMSQDAIKSVVEEKMQELGISDASQKGQLIGAVMKEIGDKADGSDVKAVVENALQ